MRSAMDGTADTSDFYKLLGIERDAGPERVKKAFNRKSLRHHPDKGGDEAVFKTRHLMQLIRNHHHLFLRLYPQCAKPKFHFIWHLPQNIDHFQVIMNCFKMERMHGNAKRYSRTCKSPHAAELCTTQRALCDLMISIDGAQFQANYLIKPRPDPNLALACYSTTN